MNSVTPCLDVILSKTSEVDVPATELFSSFIKEMELTVLNRGHSDQFAQNYDYKTEIARLILPSIHPVAMLKIQLPAENLLAFA